MQEVWFKGNKDRETRRKEVLGYRNAFEELKKVLEQNYRKKDSVRDYGQAGWTERQIAVNEYNAVLEDIYKLISLDKDK